MKKILIFITLFTVSFVGYSQVRPASQLDDSVRVRGYMRDTIAEIFLKDAVQKYSPTANISGTSGQILISNGSGGATGKDTLGATRIVGTLFNTATNTTGHKPNLALTANNTASVGTLTLSTPLAGSAVGNGGISNDAQTIDGNKTLGGVTTLDSGTIINRRLALESRTLTSATTLTENDPPVILLDATSAAFDVTLPTSPNSKVSYTFIKINTNTNTPRIIRGGANTILNTSGNAKAIYTLGTPVRVNYITTGVWNAND